MTAHDTDITQLAAQLKSLSLESSDHVTSVGQSGTHSENASRQSFWLRRATLVLGLGAVAGMLYTGAGTEIAQSLMVKVKTAHVLSDDAPSVNLELSAASPPQTARTQTQANPANMLSPPTVLPKQIIGSGYSRAKRDVILGAPLPGQIARVNIVEGAVVKKGDSLFLLEDRGAKEALSEAELELRKSRLELEKAELAVALYADKLGRVRRLVERDVVPRTAATDIQHSLASAQLELQLAQLAVIAAKAELTAAKNDLNDHVARAPFDGQVATVAAAPGMMTSGEQQDALLRLFDPQSLIVDVDIAERSFSQLTIGGPARITFDTWPDKTFQGQVRQIAAVFSKERGTVRVSIKLDEIPPSLRPNMAARATLLISRTQ
ncbi:efflux RND transporter periplasmic adaptor subunit [Pseudovibrio sp. Tun.PSC04-5.I4]|uniref:efflux RND transporter periplasmic adaptor subunit n=1 Tax=Pseudovibrio sp. Tun.PSC04-5.I4 TaxID=1798213 RepID=UPI000884F399|nr:efflux RND transporter periplasmic adaptor subunit [Pseudovibrio sp. Tun.PSC04-5.I4]SDR47076.1 RND family efflux transporter, MFP subunit [Pseudovibrio sp. Tun.PSC04-5.I4]